MLEALETSPGSADPFFWTDFAELRALIHPDRCFTRGDLEGVEQRAKDIVGIKKSITGDVDGGEESGKSLSNRQKAQVEAKWRDLINFAGVRVSEFGGSYPFAVSSDGDTLELSYNKSAEQTTYLQLLLASLMRHVPNHRRAELARHFEETCFAVFSKLMPEGSQVRATWANGGDEAPYAGTLYEKMKLISADLRCTPNFKERDFKPNDRGDGGIDLISWHPMTDEREGIPISFGQCGCSKDEWRFKQLEASPAKHYRHLPTMHPWLTYYFLPLDLRESDGSWACASDIGQAIIVDRMRLLRLASKYKLHSTLPALPLLDDVRAMEYS